MALKPSNLTKNSGEAESKDSVSPLCICTHRYFTVIVTVVVEGVVLDVPVTITE
jgi:hypothetical protein